MSTALGSNARKIPGPPPVSPGPGKPGNLPKEPPRGRWGKVRHRILHDPVAIVALLFLLVIVVCAAFPSFIAPMDPLATNLQNTLQGPSADHLLGTDNLGRDVLSRLIFASRIAVLASLEAAGIAMLIGIPVGLVIGYAGGWLDNVVMRIVDGFTALPGLIVAIAVIAALGPGIHNAMFAVGLVFSTTFVRVTRGEVLTARRQQYVEAAQVIGSKTPSILVRHILPNIVGPIAVQLSLTLAAALLVEAALSFLGLSAQPPTASWGVMVAEAGNLIGQNPFLIIPPGIAIGLTVLSLNVLADTVLGALRDEPIHKRRRKSPATPVAPDHSAGTAVRARDVEAPVADDLPTPTLEIRNLGVSVDRGGRSVSILEDVSLRVQPGETLGLVGESGSGKTITALAAMGLLPGTAHITEGSVRLDGREISGLATADLNKVRGREMAMIFQEPGAALDPAFTIGNQITEVLRHHMGLGKKDALAKAEHLLERVGIRDPKARLRSYPHELSGGMAQRVMIALAISCDPKLLIADEPTTALDVTLKVQIADLLADIQRERGMSMLFVTHELGMVAEVADRVAVMYAGQVVEEQPIDELMRSPRHPYTAGLLDSSAQGMPRGQQLAIIPGTVPSPGQRPGGCRFAPRCGFATPECVSEVPAITGTLEHSVRCIHPIR